MARKTTANTPTDEDIRSYNNVPIDVAARYIGWSSCNIVYALQQQMTPYGHAAQTGINEKTGRPTYTYNISPGLLIAYKRGDLEAWKLGKLLKMLRQEINEIIDQRLMDVVAMFAAAAKKAA